MSYRVVVQRLAFLDLDEAHRWSARRAPVAADRWLVRFRDAIASLAESPHRCPLAKENPKVAMELRELHFGQRRHAYRVIFTVDQDLVRVLRIQRAQRRPFTRKQIDEARDAE